MIDTNLETWSKSKLIERINNLEAMIDSLKLVSADNLVMQIQSAFRMTMREAKVLSALADGRPHSKRAIFEYVYHDDFDDPPEMKIIDVFISKMRKKLIPYSVTIMTVWGSGYQLEDPSQLTRAVNGEIKPIIVPIESDADRVYGGNLQAVLTALRLQVDGKGEARTTGRALAKAANLKVAVRPILERLEANRMITIRRSPKRRDPRSEWVVFVKAERK